MTHQQSLADRTVIINQFSSQQAAEQMLKAIQEASFSSEKVWLETRQEDNPQMNKTEVRRSAKGGAIAGAVLGGMVGFFISLIKANLMTGLSTVTAPNEFTFAITILGSIIGAAGLGVMGALTGANVSSDAVTNEVQSPSQTYLVVVQGTDEEIAKALEISRQQLEG